MTIVIFLATLFVLVIVHELGHFFAAKRFDIKVLEFGFGIPPKIFGKKWGETLVSLNWLPLGGFVRLLGEDNDDPKVLADKRSFAAQNVWARISVVVAGVLMNLSLAWVIFWVVLALSGFKTQIELQTKHKFLWVNQTNEKVVLVTGVSDNSPADVSGIKSGDRIIALNDIFVKDADELVKKVKENAGKKIKLTLTDIEKNKYRSVDLVPRENPPIGQGSLGVGLYSLEIANLEYKEIWQKLFSGPIHSLNLTAYSLEVFGQKISQSIAQKNISPISQSVAGPVGISSYIGRILQIHNPLIPYLELLGLLSLNLSFVNILPFPGLDGGRLIFLVIEAITRKKVSPKLEKYIHSIGLVVLIGFILLVTISDIKKILF